MRSTGIGTARQVSAIHTARPLGLCRRGAVRPASRPPRSLGPQTGGTDLQGQLAAVGQKIQALEDLLQSLQLDNPERVLVRTQLAALQQKEAALQQEKVLLMQQAQGAAGRQRADEATRLWWQLLPQAEVETVVLKVLAAEEGGATSMPTTAQAEGEADVVKVPRAVLQEVLREVDEVPAAAQMEGAGDKARVPAAAPTVEEGDHMEGLSVKAELLQLGDQEDVSQVEACLVEAQLLQLADGTTFPGTKGPDGKPLSKLLLRKCYHSIVDQCFKFAETNTRNTIVIGTPGAGKSFSAYELVRRLRLAGKTVVWQCFTWLRVLLLCPDGTAWRGNLQDFADELDSPDTWYVCDGMEPKSVNAVTVLITSPRMATINEFIKQQHGKLWVGKWKWRELLPARQYIWPTVTVAQLKEQVDTVGMLPRYALQQATVPETLEAVQRAINTSDEGLFRKAVGDITTAPPASNKLVHVVASDDCKFLAFDWASPYVEDEVTARLVQRDLDGMEMFVRDYKGVESAAQLRGAQFQGLGGAWVSAGGELSSRCLDDQTEKPLCLPRQMLLDVRELPKQLQPEHYYRFAKVTEPAVDAISVLSPETEGAPMEVILWQLTVRSTHPVAAVALRKLLLLLEKMQPKVVIRGMYFAVPADVYDQWRSRQEEKKDERIDPTSEAARTVFRQAQQQQPRRRGRPSKQLMEEAVLRDAVAALANIKQFAVQIPARGVSKRWLETA